MQFRVNRSLLALQVRALRLSYRIPAAAVAGYMGISASRYYRIESSPHLIKVPQFYCLMEAIGAEVEPCGNVADLTPQLIRWRKEMGLTQARFGALLGVSQSRIAHIEQDASHLSVELWLRLMEALRVSLYIGQQIHRRPPAPAWMRALHREPGENTGHGVPASPPGECGDGWLSEVGLPKPGAC